MFVWSLTNFESIINAYGFIPANFALLTLFTSMFLHGGFGHIFGNMWFLYLFGDNVEDKFGKAKYILFYIASGLAAALVHYLSDPVSAVPTIGASGAISGVLGAYLVFFPHAKVHTIGPFYQRLTLPAYAMLGLWFVMQFLGLFGSGGGIAFWAHIGGFAFGAAVGWIYKSVNPKQFK